MSRKLDEFKILTLAVGGRKIDFFLFALYSVSMIRRPTMGILKRVRLEKRSLLKIILKRSKTFQIFEKACMPDRSRALLATFLAKCSKVDNEKTFVAILRRQS